MGDAFIVRKGMSNIITSLPEGTYAWGKYTAVSNGDASYSTKETNMSSANILYFESGSSAVLDYYSSIDINSYDGHITLFGHETETVTSETDLVSLTNLLRGKYVKVNCLDATNYDDLLYISNTTTLSSRIDENNATWIDINSGTSPILKMEAQNTAYSRGDLIHYVTNDNENAYPDDGVQDGYYYLKVGYTPTPPVPVVSEQVVNYTMLYDEGDISETIGDFQAHKYYSGTVSMTKNANNISWTKDAYRGGLLSTNIVDLTNYSMVMAKISTTVASRNPMPMLAVNCSDTSYPDTNKYMNNPDFYNYNADTNIMNTDIQGGDYQYSDKHLGFYGEQATFVMYWAFLAKNDDWQTLCDKAGITTPADLATLLADTTSMNAIMTSETAVMWMVANCTGDFMVGALNSAVGQTAISGSAYLNLIIANPHWAKFIMMICPSLLNYTMLYDNGDECTEVGGSWDLNGYTLSGYSITAATKNTNNLYYSAGSYNTCRILGKASAINLTDYSKMHMKSIGKAVLRIDTKKDINGTYVLTDSVTGILGSADISSENGNRYICIYSLNDWSGYVYNALLTKTDSWTTWRDKVSGLTTFTTLDTLLADSTAMASLMASEDAVKYLMGCTGDLMVAVCNSATAMSALCDNIAYDYAFAHPVWYKFMTMIPTSLSAMDNVAISIPTMTGYTTPSGVASATAEYTPDGRLAWKAFDGVDNPSTDWLHGWEEPTLGASLQYKFAVPISIYHIYISIGKPASNTTKYSACDIYISSDSGSTWKKIISDVKTDTTASAIKKLTQILSEPEGNCTDIKVVSTGTQGIHVAEMQVWGKEVTE